MSNSISSSAAAVHPPVRFALNRYVPNERTQRSDEAAKQRAALRKVRYETELLAAEYAKIMLERHISAALHPNTDPALAAKLRESIMNRGVGRVREAEDDGDAKQKGGTAVEFLELLAMLSSGAAVIERTPAPRIERDVSVIDTDEGIESYLERLAGDNEVIDDE